MKGWVNIYRDVFGNTKISSLVYDTEALAIAGQTKKNAVTYLDAIEIEWTEPSKKQTVSRMTHPCVFRISRYKR